MHDIVECWNMARRPVERLINNPNDPYSLIARNFGTGIRVHHDDLLNYEEQHILTRKSTRKPRTHDAVSV